jgi:cation diffusion facilitator family transporter
VKGGHGPTIVAASSVAAAVGLTTFKLVVGLTTGSLGILSEFAHSGLDLVAALVTLFAVRAAARPPDPEHLYGHGKLENISALFETVLLLATCVWIAYEAIHRLAGQAQPVRVTVWSFVVMGVSIIVDLSRSRALALAAKKYHSQALEADALHFSTDVWSSTVVILGLIAVKLGEGSAHPHLFWRADSVAALGVAAVATWVGIRLGRRTYDVLVDRAPAGLHDRIVAGVSQVAGVASCDRVRVRSGGATVFVDVNLTVKAAALETAHTIAHKVEQRVQELVPRADVMVHTDPGSDSSGGVPGAIRAAAAKLGLAVHRVAAHEGSDGGLHVTMHLEVDAALQLADARQIAADLEQQVRREVPAVTRIDTHLEPREVEVVHTAVTVPGEQALTKRIRRVALGVELVRDCHDIHIDVVGRIREVSLHCTFDPELPMARVHEVCHAVEARLRAEIPGLGQVSVQAEPPEAH